MKILLYGYGNPGRQDDGLGNEFINRMEEFIHQAGLKHDFSFDSNYQLNIEDAEEIAGKDLVIFIDASEEEIEDYCFSKVDKSTAVSFTTHAASPGYVVNLCRNLFGTSPHAWLLHVKGYQWEFKEGLSEQARGNLHAAMNTCRKLFKKPEVFIQEKPDIKICKNINKE